MRMTRKSTRPTSVENVVKMQVSKLMTKIRILSSVTTLKVMARRRKKKMLLMRRKSSSLIRNMLL